VFLSSIKQKRMGRVIIKINKKTQAFNLQWVSGEKAAFYKTKVRLKRKITKRSFKAIWATMTMSSNWRILSSWRIDLYNIVNRKILRKKWTAPFNMKLTRKTSEIFKYKLMICNSPRRLFTSMSKQKKFSSRMNNLKKKRRKKKLNLIC
jgi:hypothetical protein